MPDPILPPPPWRIAVHGSRVSIVGAEGGVVTEILPAIMARAWGATLEDRLAIATAIVASVNHVPAELWPC